MGSRLEKKSNLVRKRIQNHTFEDEQGEEYKGSKFGGFSDYFRRKKVKLQNLDVELRAKSKDKPQIFNGIVCHVNGYTQPSLNDLHTMIVQHGGGFVQYLDGKTMVTHIIASALTPKKKEEFRRYRIVKPAWIVESIKAEKALPWDNYRVLDEGANQKVLGFSEGQVVTQANRRSEGYKEQTNTSWYTEQLKANVLRPSNPASPRESANEVATSSGSKPPEIPEITSSMENNFNQDLESSMESPRTDLPPEPRELLQVKTELVVANSTSQAVAMESPNVDVEVPFELQDESELPISIQEVSALRPREGSQEPDYSMAIVRDSDVLKSIPPARLANMTAEEHNALLLSDPRIRKSTVVNPDFLEQYYRESRLHHLSTWKADLKSQLQALAAERSTSQRRVHKKLTGQRRYVMHVDFDSFFAAVSLKKHPELQDKPAVVAHGNGSGSEIASCNYPAREFGVSNGMWMKRALQLCPDLKVLPYDFPAYEDASRQFYDAILATDGVVQSVSIDEALIDISALCIEAGGLDGVKRSEGAVHREQSRADEIAQHLRDEVFARTGCNVSVGIGGNILLAKLALRKAKPAGQYQLKPEDVLDFVGPLEVQKLPGVAWSTGGKLEELGIKLVKDIREASRERLITSLGPKTGEKLWEYARGIDKTEVGDQVVRKSVSAEVNWGVRFESQDQVDEFMVGLCGELHKRLVKERVRGKQLTMKVMRRAADAPRDPPKHLGHGKCDTYNKSMQLGVATDSTDVISKEAIAMLKSFNITPGELRGIGVQMQKLSPIKQDFTGDEHSSQKKLQFLSKRPAKQPTEDINSEDQVREHPAAVEFRSDEPKPGYVSPANASDSLTRKLLNMSGTQYVLPTQVDPAVLAELPEDIRQRLLQVSAHNSMAVQQLKSDDAVIHKAPSVPVRAQSPAVALPSESQLDPSILDALPEDVRKEVLEQYKPAVRRGEQALLPQSPRKNRTLPVSRLTTSRRKRGSGLFGGRSRVARPHDTSTLTQSNFVAQRPSSRSGTDDGTGATDTEGEAEELDPEFLAALPDDLRQEVLDQRRQARLQRIGGINIPVQRRAAGQRRQLGDETAANAVFRLDPDPQPPTFTSQKLTRLPELREAIKAWHREFLDEGPYDEDVQALVTYLSQVVLEERNMDKAVAVVKWLAWLTSEEEEREGSTMNDSAVREAWMRAQDRIMNGVQSAITARGLGKVDFG